MNLRTIRTCILVSLFACSANTHAESVEGVPNNVMFHKDGNISIRMFFDEPTDIPCAGDSHHFTTESSSDALREVVLHARQALQLITVHYTTDDCYIQSIELSNLYNDGGSTDNGPLQETGINGNVALVGTNGLTRDSYTASNHYRNDEPAAAFDGHDISEKQNEDAIDKINRGIWLAKRESDDGEKLDVWIQIDFGKPVRISAGTIHVNERSVSFGHSPKNMSITVSNDGENYTPVADLTLPMQSLNNFEFQRPVTARYYRFKATTNYGSKTFVQIDEIELYQ